jgi:hypothetical protein
MWVAREAFHLEKVPLGQALSALEMLAVAVDFETRPAGAAFDNFADIPTLADLEGFLARNAQDLVGIDESRARLLLLALGLLTRFLARHELLAPAAAEKAERELRRLSESLDAQKS